VYLDVATVSFCCCLDQSKSKANTLLVITAI
jgi:hypothetical protein